MSVPFVELTSAVAEDLPFDERDVTEARMTEANGK